MAKKGEKRKVIGLYCAETKERIYYTVVNLQTTPKDFSLMKYSPKARKHMRFQRYNHSLGRNVAPSR